MSDSKAFIFNIHRDGALQRTERLDQDVVKVGSHDKSHLFIDDPAVSRVHALIERTADGVVIMDLGSGRGTSVNGARVNKAPLRHKDRIQLGSTEIEFLTHEEKPKTVAAAEIVPDEVIYARRFLSKPAKTDGSVEIAILFRDFVMHEEIFQPPKTVTIGSSKEATYGIEHASAGELFELISVPEGGGEPLLQFAAGMEGEVYVDTQRMSLDEARSNGVAKPAGKAAAIALGKDTRARIVFGDVVVFIHRSTRPVVALPPAPGALRGVGYTVASFVLHAIFLMLVFLLPDDFGRMGLDGFDQQNRFVQLMMQDEEEEEEEPPPTDDDDEEPEASAGDEGQAGDERVEEEDRQMAVERTDPTQREIELADERVMERGALQVLNEMGPTSIFGDTASGMDDLMAIGQESGADLGAAFGSRGLAGAGVGVGGGGVAGRTAIGGGQFGVGGQAARQEGRRVARISEREQRQVAVTPGNPEVRGQLDREIIQRVIREHRREIRACYEAELQRNENLRGRVAIEFVIAPDGSVASAQVAESSLNSREVENCVTNRMRRWRFPEPRGGGIVRVTYPFDFTT
ncbi:MAG: TonB family protein [Deltaproteobacteria bacterium]|nr:MAG: TonB family protein [Deltaproteobacteria bacterium]